MSIQIEEFRFNRRPWRIDWLGRIDFPSSAHSEPRIAAYLSELKPNYERALSNASLAEPPRHRVAAVNIGLLPFLKIGSVWVEGFLCPAKQPPAELEFALHHTQVDLIRFDSPVEIEDQPGPVLAAHRYRIGPQASDEVAGSWLAIAHNLTDPKLRLLVIPSTVIFQRCLATSAKAIRRLVYGQLDKIVDPESDFDANSPTTFYVNLFQDFQASEAATLANLKADPVAQYEYERFRNTLIVESANFDRTHPGAHPETHIKLGLPFCNPVQVKARGKHLKFKVRQGGLAVEQWGFLVTELVDVKARLVFDRLVVARKNDSRQGANAGDPDLPPAFGQAARTSTAPTEPTQLITSADDPATNLNKLILEACGGFSAIDLEVVTNPKDVQKFQSRFVARANASESDGIGTTGDASGTTSGLAEVDLDLQPAPQVPITLEHFLETLDLLAARDMHFECIVVSRAYRKAGVHAVNYLPHRIKNVRSWHLTSDASNAAPRGYVVAELKHGGVWHYLIELERKGDAALALAHIRQQSGEQIERSRLQDFMLDVARANGWSVAANYDQWIFQSIRHTPSRGTQAFADAIAGRLT